MRMLQKESELNEIVRWWESILFQKKTA
jgi:hypothetical protein